MCVTSHWQVSDSFIQSFILSPAGKRPIEEIVLETVVPAPSPPNKRARVAKKIDEPVDYRNTNWMKLINDPDTKVCYLILIYLLFFSA